ncbi:AsnC family protein [Bradyrhizobium australiense]|uniref:AsnC family protein n=1 Tax=Bradyrhizobium australiense TaxID=2721161 RepID=UPI00289FB7E4|nr:AsnC family protein [Bradyrhizobium australiense]
MVQNNNRLTFEVVGELVGLSATTCQRTTEEAPFEGRALSKPMSQSFRRRRQLNLLKCLCWSA